jgi:hypothetical protein
MNFSCLASRAAIQDLQIRIPCFYSAALRFKQMLARSRTGSPHPLPLATASNPMVAIAARCSISLEEMEEEDRGGVSLRSLNKMKTFRFCFGEFCLLRPLSFHKNRRVTKFNVGCMLLSSTRVFVEIRAKCTAACIFFRDEALIIIIATITATSI